MTRRNLFLSTFITLAFGMGDWAVAQSGEPPPITPRQQVFFSPAGEPFRAPMNEPYPVKQWFEGADANHDGVLTLEEFVRDGSRFFTALDENRDGRIDGIENQRYESDVAPEISFDPTSMRPPGAPPPGMLRGNGPPGGGMPGGGMPGGGMPGGGMPGGGMPGGGMPGGGMPAGGPPAGMKPPITMGEPPKGAAIFGLLSIRQPVRSADANLDRSVSIGEFEAALATRFASLDKQKKGKIAPQDLPKTMMQMMLERVGRRL